MKQISILINTCDSYSDVWPPFFRILEKTWPEAQNYNIYLNTERKDYKDSFFNITILNQLDQAKEIPWGKRLLQALDRIDSDYILFLLEDFFFEEPVLDSEIKKCLKYLDENKDITVFGLTCQQECTDPQWCEANKDERYPGFVIRKKKAGFKFNAGPSIWRKSALKSLTFSSDTPWGWEFFGNIRTWFSKDIIYGRAYDAPVIFKYDIIHGGAVHRGRWTATSVRAAIEKYKLDLDLSKRGVEEEKDFNPYGCVPKPIYKRLDSIVKNKYKTIESMIYGFIK